MNIQRLTIFLLLIMISVSSVAYAQPKIGFVNIAKIMEQSPQAEAARKALEREFSGRDKQLTTSRDGVLKLEEKMKNDGSIMSEANRLTLERDILSKKRDYNRMRDELREDFNIRRNEELGTLQKKVYEVIQQIAKQENYDLVLTQPVLYASPSVDITDRVLKKLNATQ